MFLPGNYWETMQSLIDRLPVVQGDMGMCRNATSKIGGLFWFPFKATPQSVPSKASTHTHTSIWLCGKKSHFQIIVPKCHVLLLSFRVGLSLTIFRGILELQTQRVPFVISEYVLLDVRDTHVRSPSLSVPFLEHVRSGPCGGSRRHTGSSERAGRLVGCVVFWTCLFCSLCV